MSFAEFQRLMDRAIPVVVQMQEQAGIEIVSDGEWRRVSYSDVIADICDGFQYMTKEVQGEIQRVPVVVGELKPIRPGRFAEEARFLKTVTDSRIKIAMPSPFLLGERLWDPDYSSHAYPTRKDFTEALLPILRQELVHLRDEDTDIAQFDDTQFCLFVDAENRARYADPVAEMDYCVDMLNRIVEGIKGITLAVHLCRRYKGRSGWFGEGGYDAILPALSKLDVDLLLMEFAMPMSGGMDVLEKLPERMSLGIGCIDVRNPDTETPGQVVERIQSALSFVAPERVYMQPDCGFAPGSDMDISLDEAYGKLASMGEAARMLRHNHA